MENIENKNLWYPYAQMKTRKEDFLVKGANGVYLDIYHTEKKENKKLIDAVSSWWCAAHGYNNKEMNEAIKNQIDNFSHVMLGGLTHEMAQNAAKKIVEITKDELNHVFFSDSGSVGVEVALKMAIQYYKNKGYMNKNKFISLTHSYHGDTFKTMEIGDDPDYHFAFKELFRDCYHIDAPKGLEASDDEIRSCINELEIILKEKSKEVAAFIVEPLIQAAGGFNFYSYKYLNEAKKICDKYDVLFIFDEVATGFGRTGKMFAMDYCDFTPDIVVLGKALTGGYIGHAATVATTKVFKAFYSDDSEKAFMHGPTFMGNPLACSAMLKSIELYEKNDYLSKIQNIEKIMKENLIKIKSDKIKNIRVFGATGVVEVKNSKDLKGLQEFAYEKGVWIRPFLNYAYIMPPYVIKEEELLKIIEVLKEWFQ
ncbi:MAG: adenosylmethionine---8-amino-7-oxononanoate aminotransferase [Fusobacteriaceae bacterium]|jgi:adenosylmethionine-8-amino-7-oxononanoate aminotransferase|nr:bioA [Fusobacteriales bacterium]MDN5305321.1 adenosylmethionine---8-amino-7-oxononanoate aminotransferase [Fusobacteriaceae bacterium]